MPALHSHHGSFFSINVHSFLADTKLWLKPSDNCMQCTMLGTITFWGLPIYMIRVPDTQDGPSFHSQPKHPVHAKRSIILQLLQTLQGTNHAKYHSCSSGSSLSILRALLSNAVLSLSLPPRAGEGMRLSRPAPQASHSSLERGQVARPIEKT